MSKKSPKVLIVATSPRSRGGITSVIEAHQRGEQWKKYHCIWIETQIDKNIIIKTYYLIASLIQFILIISFYDIVHIHTSTSNCATLKSPFVFISRLLKKKIIIHLHIGDQIDTYVNHFLFKYVVNSANIIIVLSNNIKHKLQTLYNLKNEIKVIYNPCKNVQILDYHKRSKYILFAGYLNHNKGYRDLIQAFALISKKFPEWKVIIAGNGEIQIAKDLVQSLKMESQIEIKGWVSGKDKDEMFRKASVFCLSSQSEGFPMSVLEAWSYGIPVICTLVGGLPDVIVDSGNALVYDFGNIDKLASQLSRMINDDELRMRIAQKSKELAQSIFKEENINLDIANLYDSIK
ncbi:glycosyltransferase family 4 protein [Flavobacterium sp.]|uniref:glycosyltransferase family 4 protein n=1 Tax=Flavobacterium sp. TaxID=239 RepID=UPI0037534E20